MKTCLKHNVICPPGKRCKECRKVNSLKYRAKHLNKIKAYQATYRKEHKPQMSTYNKTYVAEHKCEIAEQKQAYYLRARKEYMAAKHAIGQAFIDGYKANPCVDCANTFPPECMDFDHLDSSKKYIDVSKLKGRSFETIYTEILKCDLICSNCHRTRTRKRNKNVALVSKTPPN